MPLLAVSLLNAHERLVNGFNRERNITMRRTVGVTAATTIAAGLIATTPAAASSVPSETTTTATTPTTNASALDTHKKSRKCDKPKRKKFNISWSPGMSSTTFYFNNHCKETNHIKVWATDSVTHVTVCENVRVRPGVRGSKKIWGPAKGNIDMVTFGRCPW
ncbi:MULTISPECIES: hypothetical protein [Nonomuraea]|uniref:Uncharacterized protein n=1 Tax=Nonomuraea mangrovi TaxID=2316207 RepID=A0ABW4SX46_9ACTN